ncbi:uncharacterized protein [Anas platyrhynchos]|uniref:uncharacterized protein n=1 Tax=Anas platyrhynchos TaxID=8839 RepID=UPI003AF2D414
MDKLLQKYKCAPSQAGKEFSQKFWKDEEKVVEHIEQCQASRKIGQRKGKGAICAVLGACLSCARQKAKETPAPKLISDAEHTALKSENEILKSSLAFEREMGKTLGIRVDKLLDENNKLSIENDKLVTENDKLVSENNHLKQMLERVSHLLNKVQPCAPVKQIRGVLHSAEPESWDSDFWSDSDDGVEEISDSEPQSISLRPLVKTETAVDDNDEIHTTVRTIPLPPAELVKIQEKFSRRSGESEVEYVCRVSLKGGDRMMLSEEEVGGFWRPGVFLTTTPGADLAVAVQKAACIQAIYERDEFRKSPMLAPIDPIRLTPLIRGLPDCLKMFVANTQDHILAACRDDDSGCRQNPNSPIPTWSELVQDIDKYGHRMRWINSSSIKSQDHSRRVRQIHTKNPRYPKFKERLKPNRERGELWCRQKNSYPRGGQ